MFVLRSEVESLQDLLDTLRRLEANGGETPAGMIRLVEELQDRTAENRAALAANIQSLDETNQELRDARDQVVRSARLASAGTLAAGIAHEVGNPLGAIMGFVDVARSRAEREGAETEILDAIRHEANRIDRIVRGLLDYARPERSGDEPLAVSEILNGVRVLLESQGKLTGVDVEVVIESGGAQPIRHPGQLQQVLVNLLLNALHSVQGSAEPCILVRLLVEEGMLTSMPERREEDPPEIDYTHRRRREVDLESPAGVDGAARVLVIEVIDNGTGFLPAAGSDLFDPFFTTKAPGEGTGLGLSICARLIEGMGGTIEAANLDSGGARFVVRLPAPNIVNDLKTESATEAP